MDSIIYPQTTSDSSDDIETTYAIVLVAFGIPGVTTNEEENESMAVRTFLIDPNDESDVKTTRPPLDQEISETYDQETYINSSILLTKMHQGTIEIVKEVNLDVGRKVKMEFSPCGRYFLMYYVKNKKGTLRIWNIQDSDLEGCVNLIAESRQPGSDVQPYASYEMNDLKKLKNYRFSPNGDYLLCFGDEKLVVLNLTSPDTLDEYLCTWAIDQKYFQKLHDAQILEDESYESGYRVKVACQLNEIKKIIFFEISDIAGGDVDQSLLDQEKKVPNLTFYSENENQMKVRISNDF